MEILLDGKKVAEDIKKDFEKRIAKVKENKKIMPNIAVLGIKGDEASNT